MKQSIMALIATLCVGAILKTPAAAQIDTANQIEDRTLREALHLAIEDGPSIASARAQSLYSKARSDQAGSASD